MAELKQRKRPKLRGAKVFWSDFKRTKRGVVGLSFIFTFAILAVVAPFITPWDPIYPKLRDYPAGDVPIAAELAKPTFYRFFDPSLPETIKVMPDFRLSSIEAVKGWAWDVDQPQYVNVTYTQDRGYDADGAILISYNLPADVCPRPAVARLTYNFTYPYGSAPADFKIHISYIVKGNVTKMSSVKIELTLYRIQGQYPLEGYYYVEEWTVHRDSTLIYVYPIYVRNRRTLTISKETVWDHEWIRAIGLPKDIYGPAEQWKTVFPTAGNYTFEIKVTFDDRVKGEKGITVVLDNVDILIYGQVHGVLGTDAQKGSPRDIFISIIHGAQLSVFIGLSVALIAISIGLVVGLVSGYFGGVVDEVLMRITDIFMCLPGLPLTMVLIALLGRSIILLLFILSFLAWEGFARNVRSLVLSIRERAFVEAARASGAGSIYIVFYHIFPNVITLAYLALAFSVPGAVLAEAGLAWLGFYDPRVVSWGRMLAEFTESGVASTRGFTEYWFWVIPPGMMISLLTISFILVGYSLDEILNPRLRLRR